MSQSILVVDDSSIVRLQLATVLKKNGYEVVEASNARSAVEIARRERVDLVITDVNMPGMSGLDLVSALRDLRGYEQVPIFVLTTESTVHMQEEGEANGATAWIVKPFDDEALLGGIQSVLSPSA